MSTIEKTWARYGWRVARNVTPAGQYVVDFFCPNCWKAKKAQASAPSG